MFPICPHFMFRIVPISDPRYENFLRAGDRFMALDMRQITSTSFMRNLQVKYVNVEAIYLILKTCKTSKRSNTQHNKLVQLRTILNYCSVRCVRYILQATISASTDILDFTNPGKCNLKISIPSTVLRWLGHCFQWNVNCWSWLFHFAPKVEKSALTFDFFFVFSLPKVGREKRKKKSNISKLTIAGAMHSKQ